MSSNRVRFPEEGDCVTMRMDPVASAAHVESEDLTADVAALERGWYLGFISKIVAGPEEATPWITCIVHIVPQPSSQTGPIIDFQPRCRTLVRMRAGLVHKQETVQLNSLLMHELRVDAARWWNPKSEDSASRWPGSNVEWWSEIPNRTRLLEDQWDGSDENVDNRPEYQSKSEDGELAEVPADLELAGDDTDVQPLVAFSYAWREDYGTPKEFIAEFDVVPGATTSAILLERCRQAIAERCSDPDVREQELAIVREGLRAKAFASAIPALCSVLQGDEDSNSEWSSLSAADGDASESARITGKRERRRSFQRRMLRLGSGLVRKVSGRSSRESL